MDFLFAGAFVTMFFVGVGRLVCVLMSVNMILMCNNVCIWLCIVITCFVRGVICALSLFVLCLVFFLCFRY